MKITFTITHPGEIGAGIRPFTDSATVELLSGHPGGDPGEFEEHLRSALADWFDGATVVLGSPVPEEPGPWDGIDADEFVRQVRDGIYDPNNPPKSQA